MKKLTDLGEMLRRRPHACVVLFKLEAELILVTILFNWTIKLLSILSITKLTQQYFSNSNS